MSDLPPEMREALHEFGFSDERIAQFNMESTLVKDLRICGDDFDTFYACLAKAYQSNNKIPPECIPAEFSNAAFFVALGDIIPFFNRFIKAPPLTLRKIDEFMRGEHG